MSTKGYEEEVIQVAPERTNMRSVPTADEAIEQAKERKVSSLLGTCVSDDFGKEIPATQWLFEKLQLAQGLTILGAQSFTGKTIVSLDLAIAAATGKDALGGFSMGSDKPKRVLYLDYEQQPDMLRQRIERLAHHRKLDLAALKTNLRAYSFPKLYLNANTTEDELKSIFDGYDVVFIDTLRAAMPGVEENDSGDVRGILDSLCRAATGRTIIATHHAGKLTREQKNDMRAYFRGSSGFLDACDSAYVLAEVVMKRGGKRVPRTARFMHLKNRHIGGETIHPIFISFDDTEEKKGLSISWKEWAQVESEYNEHEFGEALGDAIPLPASKKTTTAKPFGDQ